MHTILLEYKNNQRNVMYNTCSLWSKKVAACKVWSLLLSDLTSDTTNDFACIRKIQSVPALIENSIISQPHVFLPYRSQDTISNNNLSDAELDDSVSDYGDKKEDRKRRKIADPRSWNKNETKRRRMQGKEYLRHLGYRKSNKTNIYVEFLFQKNNERMSSF